MNKTLKEYTIVELKALAYDVLANLEVAQSNLRLINDELKSRAETPEVVTPEVVESKE